MKQTENRVRAWMETEGLLKNNSTIVCAVSGGADSMAMLSLMESIAPQYNIKVEAAHFNHNIRGEESDRDEYFVEDYCKAKGITYYRSEGNVLQYAETNKLGCEEAARILRYEFLEGLVASSDNSFVATAHHADDNLETVLMKVMRGTGLSGLSGIPPKRGKIIRPLLCLTRDDIIQYLEDVGLSHVEDSTNATDDYSRNRIRHKVIPLLKEECPNISYNMLESCCIVRADKKALDDLTNGIIEGAKVAGKEHHYNCTGLSGDNENYLEHTVYSLLGKEGIDPVTKKAVSAVSKVLLQNKPHTSVKLVGGIELVKDYDEIVFYGLGHDTKKSDLDEIILTVDGEEVGYGDYIIKATKNYDAIPTSYPKIETFYISPNEVDTELVVRARKDGDKIVLNAGTKTVGKVFTERKIEHANRGSIPIIADSKGVVAVYGVGASLVRLGKDSDDYSIKIEVRRRDREDGWKD